MNSSNKFRIVAGLFLLLAMASSASAGTVSGYAVLLGETMHAGTAVVIEILGMVAMTDDAGAYQFVNVPDGAYQVVAYHSGYTPSVSSPFDVSGGTGTVEFLSLYSHVGNVEGAVYLDEGGGVSNAFVTLRGTSYAELTGPSGQYTFTNVPAGQYTIAVSKLGYVSQAVSDVEVAGGQVAQAPAVTLAPESMSVAELEAVVDDLSTDLTTLTGTVATLTTDQEAISALVDALGIDVDGLLGDVAALSSSLTEVQGQVADLTLDLESLDGEAGSLRTDLDAVAAIVASQGDQISALQTQADSLDARVAELEPLKKTVADILVILTRDSRYKKSFEALGYEP